MVSLEASTSSTRQRTRKTDDFQNLARRFSIRFSQRRDTRQRREPPAEVVVVLVARFSPHFPECISVLVSWLNRRLFLQPVAEVQPTLGWDTVDSTVPADRHCGGAVAVKTTRKSRKLWSVMCTMVLLCDPHAHLHVKFQYMLFHYNKVHNSAIQYNTV